MKSLDDYKKSVIWHVVTGKYEVLPDLTLRKRRYPEMKESGAEYLGEIPNEWEIEKTKNLYKIGMGETILKEDLKENGEYPVFSATEEDKYFGRIHNPKLKLKKGDLIIPARGCSIGHIKIAKEACTTTQTTIYCQQKNTHKITTRYTYYFMYGLKNEIFKYDETAIPQLTVKQVGNNPITIPTLAEQSLILSFLEKFEASLPNPQPYIDAKEAWKKSLTWHIVTGKYEVLENGKLRKRADKELKGSGVDYIGKIPKDWETVRIKETNAKIVNGEPFDSNSFCNEATPWPVIKQSNIGEETTFFLKEEPKTKPQITKGTYLITLSGEWRVSQWKRETAYLNQRCIGIKNLNDQKIECVKEALKTLQNQAAETTIQNLKVENIKNIIVATPNKSEETRILAFLEKL